MTAYSALTAACNLLSIKVPANFGTLASLQEERRLSQMTIEAARDLARRHKWEASIRETSFTTVAQAEQTSSVPDDFLYFVPETMFNRTKKRYVAGPISTTEWQQVQASSAMAVNPVFRFRRRTDNTSPVIIAMAPTPAAGDSIYYEYVTKYFAHASGTPYTDETQIAGAAEFYFDEGPLALGIVVRYKMTHGFDYQADLMKYEAQVRDAIIRDGSHARLSSNPLPRKRIPMAPLVPETYNF